MGRLVRLIGSGIGLVHEARAARKEEKAAAAASQAPAREEVGESSRAAEQRDLDQPPPQYVEVPDERADQLIAAGKAVPLDSKEELQIREKQQEDDDGDDTMSEEGDEEQWDLDDAVEAQESHTQSEEGPEKDADALMDDFMRTHAPPAYTQGTARGRLPCPVIIPQRRPRDKKRGFVRAYAPVLEDCGIDQATFLDFLKTFHSASKSSPWLQVINIAAAGAGFVPSPIAMGVSIAVQFAVGVAMELQSRNRTNTFLDRMNNEFFKPRGLYCLILTYKPETSTSHASVNITQAISNYDSAADSGFKQGLRNIRLSSGKTYGEIEMPEAAPLIFPALDALQDSTTAASEQKSNKLKSSQKFVADYFDRRAQAKWEYENPQSSLASAVPKEKQFASRYSDPNHAASSGSLVSLITGGALDLKGRRDQRRAGKRIRKARRRGYEINPQTGKKREGLVKRMLKKDVLYMMIVNLPSEEELAAGKQSVADESR